MTNDTTQPYRNNVAGMVSAGLDQHRRSVVIQIAWQRQCCEEEERATQQQKDEVAHRELERLAAVGQIKFGALCRDAGNWRDAANIRIYVAAVRQALGDHQIVEVWPQWALAETDKLDPLASGRAIDWMT